MKAGIVISISAACLFLVATLGGLACGPDRNLIGHWEGNRDWHKMDGITEEASRAFAAVNLDFRSDGTFLVVDGGVPFEGSWSQSGVNLDLRTETVMNKPLTQQPDAVQKQTAFTIRYQNGHLFFRTMADLVDIELKKKTKPQ